MFDKRISSHRTGISSSSRPQGELFLHRGTLRFVIQVQELSQTRESYCSGGPNSNGPFPSSCVSLLLVDIESEELMNESDLHYLAI